MGLAADQAMWVRRRALRNRDPEKPGRFTWLARPTAHPKLTVVDIVETENISERGERATEYVHWVWEDWRRVHLDTIRRWFEDFVLADHL